MLKRLLKWPSGEKKVEKKAHAKGTFNQGLLKIFSLCK